MPHSRDDALQRRAHVQRRTMAVLIASQIIGTVGVGVAPSIGVLLVSEVTQNEAWAGLARTASTLGAALLGIPLGNLAARSGRRVALTTGWLVAAAGAAVLVAAAQWHLVVPLFAGLLLIGSGSAVSLQARFAATDLARPERKARSLALVVWIGTIGAVLGPNLGAPGAIVSTVTGLTVFASAFLITAVCLTLAGAIVFLVMRPEPLQLLASQSASMPGAQTSPPSNRLRSVVTELRSNARARIAVVAVLTAQIVMVSIMTMTPVHMTHHGSSINVIGVTISLHIFGMYAFAPLVGWITDRHGHRVALWLGIGIFALSLLFSMLWPHDTGWIIAALMLLGIGWSCVNVAGSALFSSSVSADMRVASQGGIDALANLCGATAAFLAGPLLAVSSFATLAIIAMIVLLPLAALVLRRLPGR